MASRYTDYYLKQVGRGQADIGFLYRGGRGGVQKGRGVGSFFSNLFRHLKPLFSTGLTAVAEQALNSGSTLLNEIGKKPIKQILKEQGKTAAKNLAVRSVNSLKRKMQTGSGIKGKRRRKSVQSTVVRQVGGKKRRKKPKKKVKRVGGKKKKSVKRTKKRKSRVIDIFNN